MEQHVGNGPRVLPAGDDECDVRMRALVDSRWSGPPPGNRNNLYRTFAKHLALGEAWNEFGRAVFNGVLSARDREILVLRVAWLSRCRFEWAYHEPTALAIGMTHDEIERVVEGHRARWDERDAALIRAADEMHESATVSSGTWAVLATHFTETELIEIPVVVGQYLLVAIMTNSLGIEPDPVLPPLPR